MYIYICIYIYTYISLSGDPAHPLRTPPLQDCGAGCLFDVESDPRELVDLSSRPEHAGARARPREVHGAEVKELTVTSMGSPNKI